MHSSKQKKTETKSVTKISATAVVVVALLGGGIVITEPLVHYVVATATPIEDFVFGDNTTSVTAQQNEVEYNDDEKHNDTPIIVGKENNNDVLQGTEASDILMGLDGNDLIFGNGGDDIICGASGNDILIGGAGNDTIMGDVANDMLIGGHVVCNAAAAGDDMLIGGAGGVIQCWVIWVMIPS